MMDIAEDGVWVNVSSRLLFWPTQMSWWKDTVCYLASEITFSHFVSSLAGLCVNYLTSFHSISG